MKRKLWLLFLLVVVSMTIVFPVSAGGDQVRGAKGAGLVKQEQVVTPPAPFP
jgi:hypothetical protein